MEKTFFSLLLFLVLYACDSNKSVATRSQSNSNSSADTSFEIKQISQDDTYGYNKKNPVKVGGALKSMGPVNERKYLNSLLGPEGQDLLFYRVGSCCPFKTKNGIFGSGLLDIYKVYWQGSKDTLTIYINMYDKARLMAPKGLRIKSEF